MDGKEGSMAAGIAITVLLLMVSILIDSSLSKEFNRMLLLVSTGFVFNYIVIWYKK